MSVEQKAEFLASEYHQVQQFYEDIENRSLQIKNWSITVASSLIGGGVLTNGWLFLLGTMAALLFWYQDAMIRGFQFYLGRRVREMEEFFNDDSPDIKPFQLFTKWNEEFATHGPRTFHYFFTQLTALPHLFLALTGGILFVLWMLGVLPHK